MHMDGALLRINGWTQPTAALTVAALCGTRIAWHMDGASPQINGCTHGGSVARQMDSALLQSTAALTAAALRGTRCLASYRWLHAMQPSLALGASPQINSCTHGGCIAWHMDGASPQINGCTHGGSIAWHLGGASLQINGCTHRRQHRVAHDHGASHRTICCMPRSIAWR